MVKKGYKQTEVGVIPEDWNISTLETQYNITSSKRVFQSEWRDSGVPFYRAREIAVMGEGVPAPKDLYISEKMYVQYSKQYGAIKENDVLITGVGTLGKVYVVKKDDRFYFKDGNIIWLQWNGRYSSQFLKHQVFGNAGGSTVPTYTITNAKATVVPCPAYQEQCDIAEVLSDTDELIATIEKQIAKKKAIKQGTMQELLTGNRRLPGFNGAWQVVKLEDICSKITDGSHESPPESDIGYYMPSVKDMRSTSFDYSECKKISYSDFKKLERNGCRPDAGDVLIAKDGSILKYAFVQEKAENIVILSSIAIVTPHSDRVDSYFLAQYFRQQNFVEQVITSYKSGTGVPRIVLKRFKQIVLFIPESVAEQAAIAKILVDMDIEITGLEKELAKYRQVKQGMMQQLLTGKIRLV